MEAYHDAAWLLIHRVIIEAGLKYYYVLMTFFVCVDIPFLTSKTQYDVRFGSALNTYPTPPTCSHIWSLGVDQLCICYRWILRTLVLLCWLISAWWEGARADLRCGRFRGEYVDPTTPHMIPFLHVYDLYVSYVWPPYALRTWIFRYGFPLRRRIWSHPEMELSHPKNN